MANYSRQINLEDFMRRVWLTVMMVVGMLLVSPVMLSGEIRTIFVTAPASFPDRSKLEAGITALRNVGYRVVVGDSCQVSLSPREKANELNKAFANPDYDAIITARGGYGSYNLLDWLDWEVIASNPKPLVGYSDITALLLSVYFKTGQTTYHGPMVAVELGTDSQSVQNIAAIFNGEKTIRFNYQSIPVIAGKMTGRLIPANLSLFQALQGTEYLGSLKDAILVLEDVSETKESLERMIWNIAHLDEFSSLRGVVFAGFTEIKNGDLDDIKRMIHDYFLGKEIPVWIGLPSYHGDFPKVVLPVGQWVEIDMEKGTIEILPVPEAKIK